jgi:hypothetical protein
MRDGSSTVVRATFAVLVVLSLVPLLRAAGTGLWEPWELNRAEAARRVADGETGYWAIPEIEEEGERPPLATWVTSLGYASSEGSVAGAKTAVFLFLILCIGASLWLLLPFLPATRGLLAAAVFFSMPVVGFQGASAGGDGVAFGAYALAFAGLVRLLEACPRPNRPTADLVPGLVGAGLGLTASYFALGGSIGLVLPVGAAAAAAAIGGDWSVKALFDREGGAARGIRTLVRGVAAVAAVGLVIWFAAFVVRHRPEEGAERFELAVGGLKAVQSLESFDTLLVRFAYMLFPWCLLVPLALAGALIPPRDPEDADRAGTAELGRHAALHLLFAYPMLAYWGWRFHPAPAVLVFPAALLVALYLAEAVRGGRHLRFALGFVLVLSVLVLRDAYGEFSKDFLAFTGFPGAAGMAVENPAFSRTLLLGTAAMLALLGAAFLASDPDEPEPGFGWYARRRRDLSDGVRVLRGSPGTPRSDGPGWVLIRLAPWLVGTLLWLALAVSVLVSEFTTASRFMYTHLGLKGALVLLALPPGLLAADLLRRLVLRGARWIGPGLRLAAAGLAGVVLALAFGVRGTPKLERQFSLAPVAEAAAGQGDLTGRLVLLQVEEAAPHYYPSLAAGEFVSDVIDAADWLAAGSPSEPRYLVLPSRNTVLNQVNEKYRERRAGALMPVISDPEARYLLAVSDLQPGATNRSPLAAVVSLTPPQPMYPVLEGDFDGKVRYLGYDVSSYADGTVGAFDKLRITHYWLCTKALGSDYTVFVHIDGMGDRINGDHAPADGLFPTRYWRPGDYIRDTHELRVPFFARPALNPTAYRIYLGLFRGDNRLPLTEGEGNDNRLWGGVLRVR